MFDDAKKMIDMILQTSMIKAHGIIGLFPAYSVGDDIVILDEKKTDQIGTLCGLRQQVRLVMHRYHSSIHYGYNTTGREGKGGALLLPFRLHLPKKC